MEHSPEREGERYAAVRQYSLAQILAVWAAAAIPMGVLAWVAAPLLEDVLGGDEPLCPSTPDLPDGRADLGSSCSS